MEWSRHPEFKVKVGRFFEPISQEDMTGLRNLDFGERSVLNRLNPSREIGLQVSGTLLEKRLDYFAMLSNGSALLFDSGRVTADTNDEKEVAGLLRFTPWADTDVDALKRLRLALGGSIGSVDDVAGAQFDLISTELGVMYLNSGAGTFDGTRSRISPQVSWAWGPVSLRGEYLARRDELAHGSPESEIRSRGWYGAFTWILTGEEKQVEDRIVPLSTWGALELAFRYAVLNIDNLARSGVDPTPTANADRINSITLGLNWWIRRNIRFTANAILERYDDEVAFDTRSDDSLFGFLFRAQVDF